MLSSRRASNSVLSSFSRVSIASASRLARDAASSQFFSDASARAYSRPISTRLSQISTSTSSLMSPTRSRSERNSSTCGCSVLAQAAASDLISSARSRMRFSSTSMISSFSSSNCSASSSSLATLGSKAASWAIDCMVASTSSTAASRRRGERQTGAEQRSGTMGGPVSVPAMLAAAQKIKSPAGAGLGAFGPFEAQSRLIPSRYNRLMKILYRLTYSDTVARM